jgi:hypothetical protein
MCRLDITYIRSHVVNPCHLVIHNTSFRLN